MTIASKATAMPMMMMTWARVVPLVRRDAADAG
jgi:hypothetical protein